MIKVSKQAEYALAFVQELSRQDDNLLLSVRQFAEKRNLSFLYLQRVVQGLKKAGLVDAKKGARGGYFLAKDVSEISMKELVEIVDGPSGAVACQKEPGSCAQEDHCEIKPAFHKLNSQIEQLMSSVSVAEFVK